MKHKVRSVGPGIRAILGDVKVGLVKVARGWEYDVRDENGGLLVSGLARGSKAEARTEALHSAWVALRITSRLPVLWGSGEGKPS